MEKRLHEYDDDLVSGIRYRIGIICSSPEVVYCIHSLSDLVENDEDEEDIANLIVECGAVPALIRHLQEPHEVFTYGSYKYQLEMAIARILRLLAVNSERQQLIVDAGALPCLVNLLKLGTDCEDKLSVEVIILMAADVITKLADKNNSIKTRVRIEGGIPPLVELLEFKNTLVQRSVAVALRTLAVDDDANKTQIVECNALPVLIQMLRFEHFADEAIRMIGALVYRSPNIMNEVLLAGALQPIIDMLSSGCLQSQREAALLVGQFADSDTDCKVHIVQRGAVGPLIQMLQSPYTRSKEMSAFALARLAQDTHNQAGIAHGGGISPLSEALVYSQNESVESHAVVALYYLADNEDNVVDFIREGVLIDLLQCDFVAQSIRDYFPLILERLEEKIHGRVLSHLLYLMRIAEINVRIPVSLALAYLCSPDDQKTVFVDHNGLGILLKLLEADDLLYKRSSCIALCKLAEKARSRSTVDTLPPSSISQVYLGEQYVNNPILSDANFLIEGKRFYAHRVCLLAASDVFRAMFDGGYKEKDAQDIPISNIRLDVLELMMRYIYTGSVDVNLEIAQDLLIAADQYLLQGLKRLCEHAIAQDIQIDNVSLMYDLSEAFNAVSLRDACILFVLENFNNLYRNTWYKCLLKRIFPEIRNCFVRLFARPMEADISQ